MDQPPPNYFACPPPILPDFTKPPPCLPLVSNNGAPNHVVVPPPNSQQDYLQPYYTQHSLPFYHPVIGDYQSNLYNMNYVQYNATYNNCVEVKQEFADDTNINANCNTFNNSDAKNTNCERKVNKPQSSYTGDELRYERRKSYTNNSTYNYDSLAQEAKRSILDHKNSRKSRDRNWYKSDKRKCSERDMLLMKYRKNFCATSEEISQKLQELHNQEDNILEMWTRSSPADLYYMRSESGNIVQTQRLSQLCDNFYKNLILRAKNARTSHKPYDLPPRKQKTRMCRHKTEVCDSSSESSLSGIESDEEDCAMEELTRKLKHPQRLHREMWYNDPGEMNDGPLCRCSARSKRSGIRHGVYPGEIGEYKCESESNNIKKLYHYRITISPPTNFLTKTPTIIKHDEHEFIFEGFSMFSHTPLGSLPTCKVIRFNIEYTILYIEEKHPEHYTMKELDLFFDYLFHEILELVDFDLKPLSNSDCCPIFHFMPRFVRDLPDNGKEILSMNEVLRYLLTSSEELVNVNMLNEMHKLSQYEWQDYADQVKGMVVTYPGCKPCSVRVDQLDRNVESKDEVNSSLDMETKYPEIVHFGIRPPQLSYAGNPEYQKAWREYVKYRHLIANMPKPSFEDKRKLESKEARLQDMRSQGKLKRDVTVALSSKGFYRTGIMCDIVQHAMLIPVLACHLRFHKSLDQLEESIEYKFKNRYLLQLALTHPSYRENFGTNPDHARNSLTNCGIRQPEYGDRKIHYLNTRKRGINMLINIMSRFGKQRETESNINHNERLEFLGDAVVEFLTSIHLFHMFPDLEEGGLATYRAAIVQNQHLAVLAKKLKLEQYMLYAHGSDLCHELELRHAMANCFEALMGALFLDGGIQVADKVFGNSLFMDEVNLLKVWMNYPAHPLQLQEPNGDRQWIPSYELLQKLTKFEDCIGVKFRHIRLLARAFTDRSIGFTNLTLGSNQRLEFLGDTVLQLISSEYLYRHFPEHHEGHLSLLRSSLVNNRTQAVVCDDLGMTQYAVYSNPKAELKTKDRADLLEALLGALYIDKGMKHCQVFCQVCLFPRLQDFIMNQDWNDPKSKLQQCCLTLRTMDGGEPDIPVYKVIECIGPTNTRVYTVAVYFRGERLATATGHSIQQAEMNCAKQALENSQDLFPQLDHQKRVIAKSMKNQKWNFDRNKNSNIKFNAKDKYMDHQSSKIDDNSRKSRDSFHKRNVVIRNDKNLPKQYRRVDHDGNEIDYYDKRNKRSSSLHSNRTNVSDRYRSKYGSRSSNYEKDNCNYYNNKKVKCDYDSNGDHSDTDLNNTTKCNSSNRQNDMRSDLNISSNYFDSSGNIQVDTTANYKDDVQIYKNEKTKDCDSDLESGEIE